MDATLYNLDAIRAKQRIATRTERILSASMALDGLELARNATSFWAAYVTGMMFFHARLMSAAFSPLSKPPKTTAAPSNWL